LENRHGSSKCTTVGENIYRSGTDIKRSLTERSRKRRGRCVDCWL